MEWTEWRFKPKRQTPKDYDSKVCTTFTVSNLKSKFTLIYVFNTPRNCGLVALSTGSLSDFKKTLNVNNLNLRKVVFLGSESQSISIVKYFVLKMIHCC